MNQLACPLPPAGLTGGGSPRPPVPNTSSLEGHVSKALPLGPPDPTGPGDSPFPRRLGSRGSKAFLLLIVHLLP